MDGPDRVEDDEEIVVEIETVGRALGLAQLYVNQGVKLSAFLDQYLCSLALALSLGRKFRRHCVAVSHVLVLPRRASAGTWGTGPRA